MSVYLVGYRGSGKTTIGRRLADRLWLSFADSDERVIKEAGKSIREQQGGVVAQRPVQIVNQLVAAGRLGQKTGRGFFDYRKDT